MRTICTHFTLHTNNLGISKMVVHMVRSAANSAQLLNEWQLLRAGMQNFYWFEGYVMFCMAKFAFQKQLWPGSALDRGHFALKIALPI